MSNNTKADNSFFTKLATFTVKQRKWILAAFIILCAVSLYTATLVKTNDSLEDFLPSETETHIGLDLMDKNFLTYGTAEIMVDNISYPLAEQFCEKLEAIPEVKEVEFDDSEHHFTNAAALFSVTFTGREEDKESEVGLEKIKALLSDYDLYVETDVGNPLRAIINKEMLIVDLIAFFVIVTVLLFTSKTYGEIPVLLLTFGAAVLLNTGTNFLMGEISFVTDSIAIVLQLALAIDYAIILCHRYMEEHRTKEPEEAVIAALSKAIPEISASSLTTISGLLALTFMKYRLGADMGFVLIKAIVFSLLSVFLLMPSLLLMFAKLIDRTHHKSFVPKVPFLGKFAYATRRFVPFLFVIILIGGWFFSSKAHYVYDQYSVPALHQNEAQLAKDKINKTFPLIEQLAIIFPTGENEQEQTIVNELKQLPDTFNVKGIADIEAKDGYYLLDELSPRQFSELLEVDFETAQIFYLGYAMDKDDYGHAVTGIENYKVPLIDMLDYVLEKRKEVNIEIDEETLQDIEDMEKELEEGQSQLRNDTWSRIVVETELEPESEEADHFLTQIRGVVSRYYQEYYIVGDVTSCNDLQDAFEEDNKMVSLLSIAFVILVLIFTFKSIGLSVLLIMVIQGSIWINFSLPYLMDNKLFFLTYLIVSAIQMGANIDYAIVISSRFTEYRATKKPKRAMIKAMNMAFPTIITSGAILSLSSAAIMLITTNETISAIGLYLGFGTMVSMLLVLFVLPQILLLGETIIHKTSFNSENKAKTVQHSGSVRLDGMVRGEIHGYIHAEIHGTFSGDLNAAVQIGGSAPEGLPESPEDEASQNDEEEHL